VSYRRPSKILVANAYLSGDVMMCRWSVTEEPTIREKRIKLILSIYRGFMQSLFKNGILSWVYQTQVK